MNPVPSTVSAFVQRNPADPHGAGFENGVLLFSVPDPVDDASPTKGELFHIRNRMKNFDIIPEIIPEFNKIRLQFHEAITEAGNYELVLGDSLMGYVSFNYTRSESAPEYYSAQDLQTLIDDMGLTQFVVLDGELESFSEEYKKIQSGIELWKWCVILALLFLGIEVLLIRYFKPSVL